MLTTEHKRGGDSMSMDDYITVYDAINSLPQEVTYELPQLKEVLDIVKDKIDQYANGTLSK